MRSIFERLPTAYLFTGDLSAGQPYLHKDDLVEAIVRTVNRRADLPEETVLRPRCSCGRCMSGPLRLFIRYR